MEIIKTLKAEEKVLEKKLRAIQVSLKAAYDRFQREERKTASGRKRKKRLASKKVAHGKTAARKKNSSKSTRRAPVERAA